MATRSRRSWRVQHPAVIANHKRHTCTEVAKVFAKLVKGDSLIEFSDGQVIYSQEDAADSVFCVRMGRIKLAAVSPNGNEAVISILEPGAFFGQGSLIAKHSVQLATATSIGHSLIARFNRQEMMRLFRTDEKFSDAFVSYLVTRIARLEADLVDQISNPAEKRLARILLLLADGNGGQPHSVIPKISQETLAQMVGGSRARVSTFMNKFRKLGLIDYCRGSIRVHTTLLNVFVDGQQ